MLFYGVLMLTSIDPFSSCDFPGWRGGGSRPPAAPLCIRQLCCCINQKKYVTCIYSNICSVCVLGGFVCGVFVRVFVLSISSLLHKCLA